MVTNHNSLTAYFELFLFFINHKVISFAVPHKISKCLNHGILYLLKEMLQVKSIKLSD